MKDKKFIRSGPHLPVKNLQETLDYYHNKLGFYEEWTWADKDGKITDGGIRRDDMRLLFGEDPQFTALIKKRTGCWYGHMKLIPRPMVSKILPG